MLRLIASQIFYAAIKGAQKVGNVINYEFDFHCFLICEGNGNMPRNHSGIIRKLQKLL